MTTVTTVLNVRKERTGRKRLTERKEKEPPSEEMPGEVPRIARLMALAIKFKGMLEDETVKDLTELARLAQVSQPRMTQVMNLTFLAPEIQEALLSGRFSHHLRRLQHVCKPPEWNSQRDEWCGRQT